MAKVEKDNSSSRSSSEQSLPFVEVTCKRSGKIRRFAFGTEAGFAVNLINKKPEVDGDSRIPLATYIEAVKEGEIPVIFGPSAPLVDYGPGWKWQTVIDSEESGSVEDIYVAARRASGADKMAESGDRNDNGQENNETLDMSDQLTNTLSRMAEFFERQEHRGQRLEQLLLGTCDDVALERFQKFHPLKFDGEPDEEKAEKWTESMEDIFAALNYSEERKVKFAVFQLEGDARAWWRIVDRKWEQNQVPRTWARFLLEFNEKFIPLWARERKEEEFISLRQGTMSVSQYEAKFTKLSKYAPEMIETDSKRRRRFLQGLTLELQNALAGSKLDTYTEIVEDAQRVENSRSRLQEYQVCRRSGPASWLKPKKNIPSSSAKARPLGFRGNPPNRPQS